jgi:hypothetical protein
VKSLKNWLAMMAAITACLLIAGCSTVRYEYFPPASEQGRMCITHCQGIREMCRGNEINRTQSERYACEQRSESVFRNCQRHANSREEAKKCYRPACNVYENTWRCDEDFRQCFVGCGGTINVIKEE